MATAFTRIESHILLSVYMSENEQIEINELLRAELKDDSNEEISKVVDAIEEMKTDGLVAVVSHCGIEVVIGAGIVFIEVQSDSKILNYLSEEVKC